MSGRPARPARYRPGKAPVPLVDESSDDDAPAPVPVQEELQPLPSHTAVPQARSAGVTIQRGDEAIQFPTRDAQDASQAGQPADDTGVDLSEYETDTDEEEQAEPTPAPPASKPAAPAAAPKRAPSPTAPRMRPITAQPPRVPPARAPAAVTLGAPPVAPSSSEGETESETESESESESESEPEPVMLKPVFVSKRDRAAAAEPSLHTTTHSHDTERDAQRKAAHDLAAERVQRDLREKKHEETTHEIDDTDDVDPDGEFAAWRLRELARIQRLQTQERQQREEREEVERRRALPEAQRLKEDLAYARQTRQEKQRGSQGFLQKYHHKGAFYQDMDILQRDYTQQTESAVNKAALPKIMQVRDFGKRSRSKWTHLANEDTTRHERDLRSQGL